MEGGHENDCKYQPTHPTQTQWLPPGASGVHLLTTRKHNMIFNNNESHNNHIINNNINNNIKNNNNGSLDDPQMNFYFGQLSII